MPDLGMNGVLISIVLLAIATLAAVGYAVRQFGWLYVQRPLLRLIAVVGFICIVGAPIAGPICGTIALGFLTLINVIELATERIVAIMRPTRVMASSRSQ